jgi:TonB family C-terminal domain
MKLLLFILFLTITSFAYCQKIDSIQNKIETKKYSGEKLIDYIETSPVFPGGEDSLFYCIESKLNYEILNYSTESNEKLIVQFVIDTIGKIELNPAYLSENRTAFRHSLIENEIFRVLKTLPRFYPATLAGKKIRSKFRLLIRIPYSNFKCRRFAASESIPIQIDVPADFKFGNGKTKLERVTEFIQSHLKYPIEEAESSISGRIYVKCIVESNGELREFKIIQSLGPFCDREAVKAIQQMPKWAPALKDGKPVRSEIVIPVLFKLE